MGIITGEKKGKWTLLNERGQDVDLPADRIYLLPGKPEKAGPSIKEKTSYLESLSKEAQRLASAINMHEVWELLCGEVREASVSDVEEIAFREPSLLHHLAARRALLQDALYFKRKKTGFEPRPPETVEELRRQLEVEEKKRKEREEFIGAVLARLRDNTKPLPRRMRPLEQLAALGSQAQEAKESRELLEEILQRAPLELPGRVEEKAAELLVRLGHFSPDEDLILHRLDRSADFAEAVLDDAGELAGRLNEALSGKREDLRSLWTVTIDAESTRDIDDALTLEQTVSGWRVGIHISDVAAVVPLGSAVDQEALRRGSSIYTPDYQIPMLPRSLSEDSLSLVEGEERAAMSFMIELDAELQIVSRSVVRSTIVVDRRLTYEFVDRVLCGDAADPDSARLLTLWEIVCRSERRRLAAGALQFQRREMSSRILPDGKITIEESQEETPARKLVSEMMIAANETAAGFAAEKDISLVFRGQDAPDVDMENITFDMPEGPAREFFVRGLVKRSEVSIKPLPHSGLGVAAYTHCTSPIRRYVDLINQRQIAGALEETGSRYDDGQLLEVMGATEPALDEVQHIQRSRNRYWLQKYLAQEGLKEIDATIVRIDGLKPLAELEIVCSIVPFAPASPVGSAADKAHSRLGQRIRLRIERNDPRKEQFVLSEI